MDHKYFSVSNIEKLLLDLAAAQEAMIYLYNIPLDHPDTPKRTPELMEAYDDLAIMCYDFNSAYQGYSNDKNYLCQDTLEMMQRATARLMGEIPEDKTKAKKVCPCKALQGAKRH